MIHEQVFVKVNALVDRGVRPLVAALNELPGVLTATSCEGDAGQDAYAAFTYGAGWWELAEFVHCLSASLAADNRLASCSYSLSIEWYAGGDTPLAYLRLPRQHVETVAASIDSATKLSACQEVVPY